MESEVRGGGGWKREPPLFAAAGARAEIVDESVLSQRKDPDLYPELTWCSTEFARIQTFREWSFGRYTALRQPQPADLTTDVLLPDARNLGLHPDAISLVAELLVAASERTQLIVTPHSDALVSALTDQIESVLVREHLGGTQLRRLSTDELSHWLDAVTGRSV